MSTKVETKRLSDFLKHEADRRFSRGLYTALTGNTFKMGQPVALNINNKLVPITGIGDEIHTYDPDAAPSAGTFKLNLWHKDGYWVETADIAYNATNTAIATACNAVLGTSAVACTGTAATTIALTFSGTGYTGLSQPLGWLDFSRLTGVTASPVTRSTSAGYANEYQTIAIAGTLSAGTFAVAAFQQDGDYVSAQPVAYNGSTGTLQTNLNAVLGTSAVTVGGTAPTAMTVEFTGAPYAGKPQPLLRVIPDGLTGLTTITVTRNSLHPIGILLQDVDASAADVSNCLVLHRDAIVDGDALYYGSADPAFIRACLLADRQIDSWREPAAWNVGH